MSEVNTDRSTIEGIDLDMPIPCAHSQHAEVHADEDAAFVVEFFHECGLKRRYPLCQSGWDGMRTIECPTYLTGCGATGLIREFVLTIVEVL